MTRPDGLKTPRETLAGLLPAAIFWSVLAFFIFRYLIVQIIGLHAMVSEDGARSFWAFFLDNDHPGRMAMTGFMELAIGLLCFEHLRRNSVEDCVLQPGRFGMLSIYLASFATLVAPELIYNSVVMVSQFIGSEPPKLTNNDASGLFPPHQLLGLFLTVIIIAPVIEEFLFRGFLMTSMEARGWSNWIVVGASSACFALLHIGYTGFGMLMLFVLGCMLGVMRIWSGGIVLPIIAHAAFNMKSFLFSYFNAYG